MYIPNIVYTYEDKEQLAYLEGGRFVSYELFLLLENAVKLANSKAIRKNRILFEMVGELGEFFEILGIDFEFSYENIKSLSSRDCPDALKQKFRKALNDAYSRVVDKPKRINPIFNRNLNKIKQFFKLDNIDKKIVMFVVLYCHEKSFSDYVQNYAYASSSKEDLNLGVMASIFNIPLSELEIRVSKNGALVRNGLLLDKANRSVHDTSSIFSTYNEKKIFLVKTDFSSCDKEPIDLSDIVGSSFKKHEDSSRSKYPSIDIEEFSHLEGEGKIINNILYSAFEKNRIGVNILLTGYSGAGKTQFVRALAKAHKYNLYETVRGSGIVNAKDLNQLSIISSANHFLGNVDRAVLLVDEAEYIFHQKPDGFDTKSWINENLENNEVPTVWIVNETEDLDRSFFRRFDAVLKISIDYDTRYRILKEKLPMVPDNLLVSFANYSKITPGVISSIANVVNVSKSADQKDIAISLVKNILSNMYSTDFNIVDTDLGNNSDDGKLFSSSVINADFDLALLEEKISQKRNLRLIFHGVPGTGKTEFANYLAKKDGKIPVEKNMSDIIDKYVGETEKNIKGVFQEIKSTPGKSEKCLIINEAESLLGDRGASEHSWERSQVNEFLNQLDKCSEMIIITTNEVGRFDTAIKRRFDLKIDFKYLKPSQAQELLSLYRKKLSLGGRLTIESQKLLENCSKLTPSAFATASRQSEFFDDYNINNYVKRVVDDVKSLEVESRGIGFGANYD